jgi:Rod binding domain-containing protein
VIPLATLRSDLRDDKMLTLSTPGSIENRKLKDAATQFESLLIASLLEKFESMSEVPGDGPTDAGGGTMYGIGIQALAANLAASGGLGIAKLLIEKLAPGGEQNRQGTKVSLPDGR